MRIVIVILLIVCSLFFGGCENTVEEELFPFETKIVIRGVIEPGKPVTNIYIGRTIPISEKFVSAFADVSDAAATILFDGRFYPLRHTANGLYRNDTLPVLPGKTYQLIVQVENKLATAETTVPLLGPLVKPGLRVINVDNKNRTYVECPVIPQLDEVFTATWVVFYASGQVSTEAVVLAPVKRKAAFGQTMVSTDLVPVHYNFESLGMRLFVYDAQFYPYYFSQGSDRTSDLVFGQPQTNIVWNVQADGIGMFIARRDTLLSVN